MLSFVRFTFHLCFNAFQCTQVSYKPDRMVNPYPFFICVAFVELPATPFLYCVTCVTFPVHSLSNATRLIIYQFVFNSLQ